LEKDYDELPKLPPAQLHNGDNISKYKLRLLFTLAQAAQTKCPHWLGPVTSGGQLQELNKEVFNLAFL
jgi:hypothetical protein